MRALTVDVPSAFAPLLKPSRYKGAYGGRGGAKSHFFAEQLILRCFAKTTRAVCIREVQDTIKDSVKQLLADKIAKLGLGSAFDILESEIRARNGSLIIFRGMQSYNAENIKSLENFDIAWVEEAQTLSEKSLRLLRPTIRAEGSELWFSWNPRHDTDPVDAFFRGAKRHPDAVSISVNWSENPWFPDVLRQEKDADYNADPEMAEHVWGGGYEIITEGAYYARMIADAEKEGRIGHFPYDPRFPVNTGWDIGVDDYTAIWFVQDDGINATVIDYYECSGIGAEDIVRQALPECCANPVDRMEGLAVLGRKEPFRYGTHYLPHDVKLREWGAGARSRYMTLLGLGVKPIIPGANQGPQERISAVRRILPATRFNLTSRVQLGLTRLRRYRRKFNDALGTYTTPLHDEASHGADAFGEWAVNCPIRPIKPVEDAKPDRLDVQVMPNGQVKTNLSVFEIIEMKRKKREANR